MKRTFVAFLLFCCTCLLSYSQNEKWQVYPAYTEAVQVEVAGDYLFCVMKGSGAKGTISGNLVRYDLEDGSIRTYDCLHELSDKEVLHVSYNKSTERLVVVYENGNVDLVDAYSRVVNQTALKESSIPGASINSINHFDDIAYLCTSEFIIKLDVAEGIVLDAYKVGQAVYGLFNIGDKIYIALSDGIRAIEDEVQLANPRSWKQVCDVEISKIVEFAGVLYVITPKEQLYYVLFDNGTLRPVKSGYSFSKIFVSDQRLLCLNYGDWLGLYEETSPISPTVFMQKHDWQDLGIVNDRLYVTDTSGNLCEYKFDADNKRFILQSDESVIKINSPKRDRFYRMHYEGDRLLVAGGVNPIEPAYYPVTFMYMEPDGSWVNFDETQVLAEFPQMNNINALNLVQDPFDDRHFYGAVWRNGLHEYYTDDDGYLELLLAFTVAAPHSLDVAALLVCDSGELFKSSRSIGSGLSVSESLFVNSLKKRVKTALNLVNDIVDRNEGLLAVVTSYDNALVLSHIARTDLDAERNALHLVLGELPSGALIGIVKLSSDSCSLKSLVDLRCRLNYALLVLLNGDNNNLNGSY